MNIYDVAEQLAHVSNHGHYLSAICPYHDDSAPSLMVYNDGFHCKACGERGSLEKLRRKLSGVTVSTAQTQVYKAQRWILVTGYTFPGLRFPIVSK